MSRPPGFQAWADQVSARTRDLIAKRGYAVPYVFPTEDDHPPPFAYTVGLTSMGLPELIISGPPPFVVEYLFAVVSGHMLDGAHPREFWTGPEVLTETFSTNDGEGETTLMLKPVTWRAMELSEHYMSVAKEFYGPDARWDILQVVWADNEFVFPTEPDYNQVRFPQRKIWEYDS